MDMRPASPEYDFEEVSIMQEYSVMVNGTKKKKKKKKKVKKKRPALVEEAAEIVIDEVKEVRSEARS